MSKHFKLTGIPFFLFVFFLMSSCADDDTTATNTTTSASTSTPASTDAQAATSTANKAPAEGTLNKIWIDAQTFHDLRNARLVFSFAIDDQNHLTLYGWSCQGNGPQGCNGQYAHNPDLQLQQGLSSGVEYGPVAFWENLILERSNVEAIQNLIGNYHFVEFRPKNINGHISYRI